MGATVAPKKTRMTISAAPPPWLGLAASPMAGRDRSLPTVIRTHQMSIWQEGKMKTELGKWNPFKFLRKTTGECVKRPRAEARHARLA